MKVFNQFPKLQTFSQSAKSIIEKSRRELDQNEHVYALCCRQEVAGEVICSGNVKTIESYAVLNFKAASFSSFRENQNKPFS